MKKWIRALSLILVLALMGVISLAEETTTEDPVVASIGEETLKLSDVEYYAQQLAAYGMIETVNDVKGAVEYALQYYLLPRAKVAEYGIANLLGEEYDQYVAQAEQDYEDTLDSYVAYFAEEGADDEALAALRQEAVDYFVSEGFDKEAFINEMLIGSAYDKLIAAQEFTVTEQQIEEQYELAVQQYASYFADNVDMYEYYVNYYGYEVPYRPAGYRGVIHILLSAEEALQTAYSEAEDDEARAKVAEEILASLREKIEDIYARLDAGEDFLALLEEYNEDPGMAGDNLVDGYAVHASSVVYVPEFTAGAFSDKMQKVGDVSDPVVSSYGVHIMKYVRDIPEGAEPMSEDARASIEEFLKEEAEAELVEAWLAETNVVYTELYYSMIGE